MNQKMMAGLLNSLGIDPSKLQAMITAVEVQGPAAVRAMHERVCNIENKLDRILTILEADISDAPTPERMLTDGSGIEPGISG